MALLGACGADGFEVQLRGQATLMGAPPDAGEVPLSAFPTLPTLSRIDFDSHPDFKNQGISRAEVHSARVRRATLTLVSPSDGSFDFLDEV